MIKTSSLKPLPILGAGSWGTALAIHLAKQGQTIRLWDINAEHVNQLAMDKANKRHLPDFPFPESIKPCLDLQEAVLDVEQILIAVPSHGFVSLLERLKPLIKDETAIVWVTKGIEPESCELLHQFVESILGKRPMAAISGPSFAKEVAAGAPTAVSMAATQEELALSMVERFHHENFRLYRTADLIGVQLGGAIKNVLAIATGIADGLNYGANTRAALITRGLAEMSRLGQAMGANAETFSGLSGLGDLVLTCSDNQSRNRRFGLGLASGKSADAVMDEIGQVVEGRQTVEQVLTLSKRFMIEMPITEVVSGILKQELTPQEAAVKLLSRPPRDESAGEGLAKES